MKTIERPRKRLADRLTEISREIETINPETHPHAYRLLSAAQHETLRFIKDFERRKKQQG